MQMEAYRDALKNEFNNRLKDKLPAVNGILDRCPYIDFFGKEMVLLAWAIEHCDPSVIPTAIKNWLGLAHGSAGGFYHDQCGNRWVERQTGLAEGHKIRPTENPVEETYRQMELFDF